MTKVKRNFKDSLFRLVFHGKEELLSLYNAVNGSRIRMRTIWRLIRWKMWCIWG